MSENVVRKNAKKVSKTNKLIFKEVHKENACSRLRKLYETTDVNYLNIDSQPVQRQRYGFH